MVTPLGAVAATECSDCAGFLPCPPGQVRGQGGYCVCAAGHYNTRYNWVYANHSHENRSVVDSADVALGLEHLEAIGARLKPATPTERKTEPLPVHLTFVARCHRGDSVPRRSS